MSTAIDQVKCRVCKAAFKNTSWNMRWGREAMIKFHQKIPLHKEMESWSDEKLEEFARSKGNTMGYARNYKETKEEIKKELSKTQTAINFNKELYDTER